MAQILTDYDISGGDTFSSVISSPSNLNVSFKTSSVTLATQVVTLQWWVQVGSEDYHQLKDENGKFIVSKLKGDESDNVNVFGINATNVKIKVITQASSDGTLNIYTVEN